MPKSKDRKNKDAVTQQNQTNDSQKNHQLQKVD